MNVDKTEKLLIDLEFTIDDFLNDLRSELEETGIKKKHRDAITEIDFIVKRLKGKLWPRSGPIDW